VNENTGASLGNEHRMIAVRRRLRAGRETGRLAAAVFAIAAASCTGATAATVDSGCIAPANPGGGWDLTCRMTADALSRLDSSAAPIRVINLPGDGGGVAFSRVVSQMRGNTGVIVAASPSTVLGLVQHHYGHLTEHDVRWIAAVGTEPSVIAVRADAPWRSLSALVADWRAHPEKILTVGASVPGGQDHMKILVLARAVGLDVRRVRYAAYNSPLDAIGALMTDTAQVFPGDASEVGQAVAEHRLRVLAVLSDQRALGVLAGVPTAQEQGIPVTWSVWRGFYAPPGISDAAYAHWVDRLTRMAASPSWNATLARNGLSPFFLAGKAFEDFLRQQTSADSALSQQIGLIK
jgi:putative tricarboxylic transport membrane protein